MTATKTATSTKVQAVTEAELQQFCMLSDYRKQRKAELAELESELDALEVSVMERLKAGAKVQSKTFHASIHTKSARNVSWKGAFAAMAKRFGLDGDTEVKAVQDATTPTVTESLAVLKVQ